jgi:hypothetical protein
MLTYAAGVSRRRVYISAPAVYPEVSEVLEGLAVAVRDADVDDGKFAQQVTAGSLCVLLEVAVVGGGGGAHAAVVRGDASATRWSYSAVDNAAPLEACVSKIRHDLCARLDVVLFRYPLFVHVQRACTAYGVFARKPIHEQTQQQQQRDLTAGS